MKVSAHKDSLGRGALANFEDWDLEGRGGGRPDGPQNGYGHRPTSDFAGDPVILDVGDNAAELLAAGDVDGALVGGASLTAAKFVPIVEAGAALAGV